MTSSIVPIPMESHPPALTEDLIGEIFLRLPSLNDLAWVSIANISFHHIITNPYFLRRVPCHRHPSFLGFLTIRGFHPVQPPHPSAPISHALATTADFSFSFLPSPSRWIVQDICDGRVLLGRNNGGKEDQDNIFMNLAICDPLSRRYVLLPPIPDDLHSSVQQLYLEGSNIRCETFLVPRGEGAMVETSFTVIWMARHRKKLVALVFSSVAGQWHAIASPAGQRNSGIVSVSRRVHSSHSYAYGCFYWKIGQPGQMLALDTRKMEFSISNIPLGYLEYDCAVIEAGEGRLGIFALFHHIRGTRLHLYYKTKKSDEEDSNEWRLEKTIQLPLEHDYRIISAANGCLLMQDTHDPSSIASSKHYGCISMDVKTFHFERVCGIDHYSPRPIAYFGFPPSLSAPSI